MKLHDTAPLYLFKNVCCHSVLLQPSILLTLSCLKYLSVSSPFSSYLFSVVSQALYFSELRTVAGIKQVPKKKNHWICKWTLEMSLSRLGSMSYLVEHLPGSAMFLSSFSLIHCFLCLPCVFFSMIFLLILNNCLCFSICFSPWNIIVINIFAHFGYKHVIVLREWDYSFF